MKRRRKDSRVCIVEAGVEFQSTRKTHGIPGFRFALACFPFRKLQILRDPCSSSAYPEPIFLWGRTMLNFILYLVVFKPCLLYMVVILI